MGIITSGLHQPDFASAMVSHTTSGAAKPVKLGRRLPSWTADDGAHGMLDEIAACYGKAIGRLMEMCILACLEAIYIIMACAL